MKEVVFVSCFAREMLIPGRLMTQSAFSFFAAVEGGSLQRLNTMIATEAYLGKR